MKHVAIIPARGGSKRIPRKNIRDFLGKPIIAYSIEIALKSKLFDEVMVSTDDDEIAEIAVKFGAKVPFKRSEKAADDFASTDDVVQEVLLKYKEQGKNFDKCCCIYPCAPLISMENLQKAYHLLDTFDSVFPVVQYSYPIQRALKKDKQDKVSFFYPEYIDSRSQDLETSYHDAGQFYWLDVTNMLSKRDMISDNSGAVVISELEAQDIDNETDWQLAEIKFKLQRNNI